MILMVDTNNPHFNNYFYLKNNKRYHYIKFEKHMPEQLLKKKISLKDVSVATFNATKKNLLIFPPHLLKMFYL